MWAVSADYVSLPGSVPEFIFPEYLNSVSRPQHDLERRAAPRAALSAPQLLFERHQARMTGPPLQQHSIRNESLVCAGVTARRHQVKDAQILETEGVARGHGRGCHFPGRDHIEQNMNKSTNENLDASLPYLPWAGGSATLG
jgi:hypothetical protein